MQSFAIKLQDKKFEEFIQLLADRYLIPFVPPVRAPATEDFHAPPPYYPTKRPHETALPSDSHTSTPSSSQSNTKHQRALFSVFAKSIGPQRKPRVGNDEEKESTGQNFQETTLPTLSVAHAHYAELEVVKAKLAIEQALRLKEKQEFQHRIIRLSTLGETAEAVKDQVISDLQANTNCVLHDNTTIRKNSDESRSAKNLEIDDLVRIILAERGAHAAVKNRLKTCFIRNKTLANLVRGQKLELKRRRSNMRTQQRRLNTRKVTIRNLRTTQERLESLNRHLLLRNTELVEDFDQYTDDVDAQLLMTNELRHVNVTPATRGTHDMLVRNFIYTTATTIGSRVCSMYRTPGLMTFVDHAATTKFFVDVVMQGVDIIGSALLKPGFWLNPVNCRISVYRYMKRAYGTEYCTVVSLAQLMFEVKKFNNWVRSLTPVYHYLLLPQERMMQDAFP